MHAYIQIYTYTQICTNCSECIRRCVRWCKKHTCVTYTPAHALVPKTPFPKCMQHSLQKNAHIYIPTHICIRRHMHTNTHAHAWHRPHAEALIQRPTIYAQIRIHIHIHMCINAYMYIYIHICIYIHVYMSAHIHTYTYIHTHIQNVHMNARTHAWNDGAAANARGAVADEGNFARFFRLTQCTCGVLGCKLRGQDETPRGPDESRLTNSRHTYIRICVLSTHVYVFVRRRDEILD